MSRQMKTLAALALILAASGSAAADRLAAYISGGVGLEERSQFLTYRDEFNLRLVYAVRKSGHYLANVETIVADEAGEVLLKVRSEGPFVYAKLAPGRYRIAATFRDETQRRDITVAPDKATVLQLYWDDPVSQAEGRSRRPEGFYRH